MGGTKTISLLQTAKKSAASKRSQLEKSNVWTEAQQKEKTIKKKTSRSKTRKLKFESEDGAKMYNKIVKQQSVYHFVDHSVETTAIVVPKVVVCETNKYTADEKKLVQEFNAYLELVCHSTKCATRRSVKLPAQNHTFQNYLINNFALEFLQLLFNVLTQRAEEKSLKNRTSNYLFANQKQLLEPIDGHVCGNGHCKIHSFAPKSKISSFYHEELTFVASGNIFVCARSGRCHFCMINSCTWCHSHTQKRSIIKKEVTIQKTPSLMTNSVDDSEETTEREYKKPLSYKPRFYDASVSQISPPVSVTQTIVEEEPKLLCLQPLFRARDCNCTNDSGYKVCKISGIVRGDVILIDTQSIKSLYENQKGPEDVDIEQNDKGDTYVDKEDSDKEDQDASDNEDDGNDDEVNDVENIEKEDEENAEDDAQDDESLHTDDASESADDDMIDDEEKDKDEMVDEIDNTALAMDEEGPIITLMSPMNASAIETQFIEPMEVAVVQKRAALQIPREATITSKHMVQTANAMKKGDNDTADIYKEEIEEKTRKRFTLVLDKVCVDTRPIRSIISSYVYELLSVKTAKSNVGIIAKIQRDVDRELASYMLWCMNRNTSISIVYMQNIYSTIHCIADLQMNNEHAKKQDEVHIKDVVNYYTNVIMVVYTVTTMSEGFKVEQKVFKELVAACLTLMECGGVRYKDLQLIPAGSDLSNVVQSAITIWGLNSTLITNMKKKIKEAYKTVINMQDPSLRKSFQMSYMLSANKQPR